MNYFMIGGDKQEYGPADAESVRQWIREGRANGDTMLRYENETGWRPLRSFPEFLPALPAGTEIPKVITVNGDTPVQIGHAFGRAWHLVNDHFATIGAATLMVWMALTTILIIPYIGQILSMLFTGPLLGAFFLLFLKLIRTGEGSASELFTLIKNNTLALVLTGVVTTILSELAMSCCCLIPGVYLNIAWLFAIPIVADQAVNFWAGMEISRRIITPHWFKFLGLFFVAFLPVVVFHVYMTARQTTDLSPYITQLIDLISDAGAKGSIDKSQIEGIQKNMLEVLKSYASWQLIRQLLLLVSLPLGIGTFAFVYEDFFGRKK